jgi:regulator of protease activity HflC (stomatin/prohibitin superfamily)
VRRYNLQLEAHKERLVVLTSDDLKIEVAASIIVFPERGELAGLEQEIGRDYYDRVVRPKFRTSIRNVLSEYSMVQVSKKTPTIEGRVREMVIDRLKGRHIQVHDVILEDIQFSAPVLASIEQKLSKEQEQEQRKFEIEISRKDAEIIVIRAKAEAEATRVRAQAQAEAQRIIEESLGHRYLQFKALDNPNAKYFFLPTGKDGVPVLINTDGR